jgi:lysophospholipase L1-like esterase
LRFRLSTVAVIAASVGLISSCAPEPPPASAQVHESPYSAEAQTAQTETPRAASPVRIAIFGDSISEAGSPDFTSGRFGALSWASYLGEDFSFAGGWAKVGARTSDMLAYAKPLTADVLVVIAGTNDYRTGVPFNETAENLDRMVATAGVGRVIVSSVPPNDFDPAAATALNERLAAHVRERGWTFFDAMSGLRSGDRFAAGMTSDGVHPSEAGAQIIGATLSEAIRSPG